jgi:hypothetical protein
VRVPHTAFGRAGLARAPTMTPSSIRVAVLMSRTRQPNAWEDWGFAVADVTLDDGRFGDVPRVLRDDGRQCLELHPGLEVVLRRDECEGYHLNLSAGQPVWFVMWRVDGGDPPHARPEIVTLSYDVAGRLLDAQERVDNRPLPDEVAAWLQAYNDAHYRPQPKQRSRPASFRRPEER